MNSARSSPYPVSASELVQRFATSDRRCRILEGLFRYRAELRKLGFARGFQWLDGSFAEDVEAREGRPPNDLDLVTFTHPPPGLSKVEINQMLSTRPDLFDHDRCKAGFLCDTGALINLTMRAEWLVTQTRYWYGLYSHRRGDALWKGMLELPMESDDDAAVALLQSHMSQGGEHAGAA